MALIQQTSNNTGGGGGAGNVTGIPPTTDKAIARWVGISGDLIENSPGTLVQDSGAIEAAGFITQRNVTSTITVNNGETWIAPALIVRPTGVIILNPNSQLIIL